MGQRHTVPPKPPEVQHKTLSAYFDYTYRTKLCFKRSADEVHDITEAVIKLVNEVIKEVGRLDERFEVRQLIFVGSMMEGTKNGEPNEFDFLAIVRELSFSDRLKLTRQCDDKKGFVHIQIKENGGCTLREDWNKIIDNGHLKSMKSAIIIGKSGFRCLFLNTLGKAVGNIKRRKEHGIVEKSGCLVIHSSDVEKHGPACLVVLEWKPVADKNNVLLISIDITPAIQVADVGSVIEQEEVGSDGIYQQLEDSGTFMCISSGKTTCDDGLCFKLTFTNTEMNIMLGLSPHHIKCYRILKYLFNGLEPKYVANIIFHSYALKTFVLKHHNKGTCNGNSLADCIIDLLSEITQCLESRRKRAWYSSDVNLSLPSLILPCHNIFDRPFSSNVINANNNGMEALKKSLDTVANLDITEDEDLDERFGHYEIARVNLYAPRVGPPPPNYNLSYHRMTSSRNMMLFNSMTRVHTMNTHMHMRSFRH